MFRLIAFAISLACLLFNPTHGQIISSNLLVTANLSTILVFDLNTAVFIKSISLAEQPKKILLSGSQYVIASTPSNIINVWELSTNQITCSFTNVNDLQDMMLIDAQSILISGYTSYSIRNFKTCKMVYTTDIGSYITSISYFGSGNLAIFSDNALIRIFNVNSLTLKTTLTATLNAGLLYFSDKYFFFTVSNSISVWNLNSNFSFNKLITYNKELSPEKLFGYSDYIVTNQINEIFVFSLSKGSLVKILDPASGGHRNTISDMVLFSKSGLLASGGSDHVVKIWDLNKLTLKYTFDPTNGGHAASISKFYTVGTSFLLSTASDLQCKLWNLNTGRLVYSVSGYSLVDLSANANFVYAKPVPNNLTYSLITASKNSQPKFWSMSNGKLNSTLNFTLTPSNEVAKLVVVENKYVCTAHLNGELNLWSLANNSLIAQLDTLIPSYSLGVSYVEYLGNGLLAASRFKSVENFFFSKSSIKVWDLNRNFQLKSEIRNSNGNFFGDVTFRNIAKGYLWISEAGSVWDLEKKVYKSLFKNSNERLNNFIRVNSTHFAGMVLNTQKGTAFVRIYSTDNLSGFTREHIVTELKQNFYDSYIYPIDDSFIAASFGFYDFRIMILNLKNGNKKCLISANSHTNTITTIVNVGYGRFASGGRDAFVKVWDLNACSLIATFDNYEVNVEKDRINKLASMNGIYLASMSQYSAIKVWDLETLKLKYKINGTTDGSELNNYDLAIF